MYYHLGVEVLDPVDSNGSVEDDTIYNRAANDTVASESAVLLSDMTSITLPQESREFHNPDASGSIPPDQLRMIGSINSLISEVAIVMPCFLIFDFCNSLND